MLRVGIPGIDKIREASAYRSSYQYSFPKWAIINTNPVVQVPNVGNVHVETSLLFWICFFYNFVGNDSDFIRQVMVNNIPREYMMPSPVDALQCT